MKIKNDKSIGMNRIIMVSLVIAGIALGVLLVRIIDNYSSKKLCAEEGKAWLGNGQCLDTSKVEYCKSQGENQQIYMREIPFALNIS